MAILKILCEFNAPPVSPVVTVLPKKYGKQGYVSFEFDDGSTGAETLKNQFETFYYTDGCGNNINYKGSLAVNGNFEVDKPGYDPSYITPSRLLGLINSGWDILNHSYTHGGDPSRTKDLIDLEESLLRVTGYLFNGIVVPSADQGFVDAGVSLGYGFATSQNGSTFDSVPGTHKLWPDALGDDPEFFAMVRDFNDNWSSISELNYYKSQYDMLFTGERNFHIFGSHDGLQNSDALAGILSLFDYLRTISTDRIAVGSMREFVEYRQMRHCPINQYVSGNSLTIEVDTANLPARNRWEDISLNVSGGPINSVTVEGFSSVSFNSNGLVNAFKQNTIWGPPPEPNPPIKASRNYIIG